MFDHDRDQGPQQPGLQKMSQQINALVCVFQIVGLIGDVFMRRWGSWGSRHAGMHLFLSWVFMFCFGPLFFPLDDPMPMIYLWCAATALLLLHRIAGGIRRWRGRRIHSLYGGRSWWPGSETTAKTVLEPLTFVGLAAVAVNFSIPMAAYFVAVALCGGLANAYQAQAEEARLQAAEDAWHDAQYMQYSLQRRMGQ